LLHIRIQSFFDFETLWFMDRDELDRLGISTVMEMDKSIKTINTIETVGLDERFRHSLDRKEYIREYLDYFAAILEQLDVDVIEQIIVSLGSAAERNSSIFLFGNGGSAANASHMANDLAIGARVSGHSPFRVYCLSDNVPIMTALANDEDYSQIFVSQLRYLLQPDDVVIGFSVSGNSENVLEAVRYANEEGAITIGCGGFDGGDLSQSTDIYLHVPSHPGEYGPVEDVMMVLDHLIHSYFVLSRNGTLRRRS
jgi:D-sedoheptulose 7-phosphate isomerase